MTFSNIFNNSANNILADKKTGRRIIQLLISTILLLPATMLWAESTEKNIVAPNAALNGAGGASEQTAKNAPRNTPKDTTKDTTKAINTQEAKSTTKQIEKTNWHLSAEQWELARSGETILSLQVLKRVVKAWLEDRQKQIEIQYPGGEDGELWVQELTNWLVSLGVPSKKLIISAGSGSDDVIKFNVIN